jgi:hypothetical protein
VYAMESSISQSALRRCAVIFLIAPILHLVSNKYCTSHVLILVSSQLLGDALGFLL